MRNDGPLALDDVELLAKYGATYPWMPQQTLALARKLDALCPICRDDADVGTDKCCGPSATARMLGIVLGDLHSRDFERPLILSFLRDIATKLSMERVSLAHTTFFATEWAIKHPVVRMLGIDPLCPVLVCQVANEYLHHGLSVDEFVALASGVYDTLAAFAKPEGNA